MVVSIHMDTKRNQSPDFWSKAALDAWEKIKEFTPDGMGGKETVHELLKINPILRAIVSSGYANDPILANYLDYAFQGLSLNRLTWSSFQTHLLN